MEFNAELAASAPLKKKEKKKVPFMRCQRMFTAHLFFPAHVHASGFTDVFSTDKMDEQPLELFHSMMYFDRCGGYKLDKIKITIN